MEIKKRKNHLVNMQSMIASIVHEVNVAESIDLNKQSRHHISQKCYIIYNQAEQNWNELGFWMANNLDASVKQLQTIRGMLRNGDSVRGFTFNK